MEISTRECLKTVKGMDMENALILMGVSTQANILMINPMAEVNLLIDISILGLYIWKDGERYEGEWRDGKFHGKGIKTLPDGTIFDGDWEDGRPVG
jgi:hypothetical protein